LGRGQAARLAGRLTALKPDARPQVVMCSPYTRARQTAEIIVGALGDAVSLHEDDGLVDRRNGILSGLTPRAIRERHPDEQARRETLGPFAYQPPGGESLRDVATRLREVVIQSATAWSERRVLVVAHDAIVLMLRQILEGLSEADLGRLGPVANASLTSWAREGTGWRLATWNETAHLR
jgi:2,3-bisphosphoglycerate-dependent phosphoglycerate mutase